MKRDDEKEWIWLSRDGQVWSYITDSRSGRLATFHHGTFPNIFATERIRLGALDGAKRRVRRFVR